MQISLEIMLTADVSSCFAAIFAAAAHFECTSGNFGDTHKSHVFGL